MRDCTRRWGLTRLWTRREPGAGVGELGAGGTVSGLSHTLLNPSIPDRAHDVLVNAEPDGVLAHLGLHAEQRAQDPVDQARRRGAGW